MKLATRFGWTPAMAMLAFIMALVSPAVAQDTEGERATLAGLTGVWAVVEGNDPDAERDGLTKATLQTDLELRLRQAGIRVLTNTEWLATPGFPYLYLVIAMRKVPLGIIYTYGIRLELRQRVNLARDPTISSSAATWQADGTFGTVGTTDLSRIRGSVRDRVDEFINDYLAANPKR